MILEQFYLQCLSHASYLLGDESSGRAVVVDPQRDVAQYLEAAAAHGLAIERVIETHLHADFLSGHLELADRTGAVISYGEGVDVEYPVETLADGARLSLGDLTLQILATPGHTPESISVVVYEHAEDTEPYAVLTGDALFIGDVGRPDLLATAGSGLTADVLARRLYHSLHDKLLQLPDATRVYPAHGAGSACGKQLSTETWSTLGEQRRTNYALAPMTEDDFVAAVTEGQPVAPAYFSYDASRNREARPLLDEDVAPPPMDLDAVLDAARAGAVLLDTREPTEFARGHLRGAVNVGLGGRFAEYAGDVLRPDQVIVLVGDRETALEAKVRLGRIGFDRVAGYLADPLATYTAHPERTEPSSRLTVATLRARLDGPGETVLLDVRSPGEVERGAIPNARPVPLPVLAEALDGLDPAATTVVYCATGYRSSVAASLLRARGFTDVSDLLGGYEAWAGPRPVGAAR
jgi:glyoxylase-like metal-dependent hydrolase (beta-lactamase superfamily II)/rhodanese-related sulfurtransferase